MDAWQGCCRKPDDGCFCLTRRVSHSCVFLTPRPKGKPSIGKVLQRGLFERLKRSLGQLIKDQRKIPSRFTPASFGAIPMEIIKEAVEIFIPTNVNGKVSQLICNDCSIAIYCAGLQFLLLKKVQEEIRNLFYGGTSVHLVVVAPMDEKGSLCFIH